MTNTAFGRLFYLNNYTKFSDNSYLKQRLPQYLDYVLRAGDDSYVWYIASLKQEYNHNNYMCMLENITNYFIKVFNITYQDYVNNGYDKAIEPVLQNIVNKHNNLLKLYNAEFDKEHSNNKEDKDSNIKVYRRNGLKKHKVYKVSNYR